MIEFRLVEEMRHKQTIDTIGFEISTKRLVVAILVTSLSSITEDIYGINTTTASDSRVLKVLHKNDKGIFYTLKHGKGYGAKTSRTYLTEFEVNRLHEYLKGVRYRYEEVQFWR